MTYLAPCYDARSDHIFQELTEQWLPPWAKKKNAARGMVKSLLRFIRVYCFYLIQI